MKEPSDSKSKPGDNMRGGKQFFKKKGKQRSFREEKINSGEFFKRVGFWTGKEGPELYAKTIERLGLYVSTQFKNGSDVKKCLMKEKVVKPVVPTIADNHIAHKKRVEDHR